MGFETPQFNTGEVPSENKPEKKGGLKNKLQKLAVFGAIGVAALAGEGCAPDKSGEQKGSPKGPEPIVQKSNYPRAEQVEADGKRVDDLLNHFLSEASAGHMEKDNKGNTFIDFFGGGSFYRLKPYDVSTMRQYVIETYTKMPVDASQLRRSLEEQALKIRLENHIQVLCERVTDPSFLPPKMQERYHELESIGVVKDSKGGVKIQDGKLKSPGQVRNSPDFEDRF